MSAFFVVVILVSLESELTVICFRVMNVIGLV